MDKCIYMYCVCACVCVCVCVRERERERERELGLPQLPNYEPSRRACCQCLRIDKLRMHTSGWSIQRYRKSTTQGQRPSTCRLIQTGRGPQTHNYLNTNAWGRECHSVCIRDYPSSMLSHVTAFRDHDRIESGEKSAAKCSLTCVTRFDTYLCDAPSTV